MPVVRSAAAPLPPAAPSHGHARSASASSPIPPPPSPPVRHEPASQPNHKKKAKRKKQQSGLHFSITQGECSTIQLDLNVRGTQAETGPGKRGALEGAKGEGSSQHNMFNAGNEQDRHQRLSHEFGEVPTPVSVAPDDASQQLPRTRQGDRIVNINCL